MILPLLFLLMGCRNATTIPSPVPSSTLETPTRNPASGGNAIEPDRPFNLEDLISDDPDVRRAALAVLPVEEIERVPETLVPELAEMVADEAGHTGFREILDALLEAGKSDTALRMSREMARALDEIHAPEASETAGVVFGRVFLQKEHGSAGRISVIEPYPAPVLTKKAAPRQKDIANEFGPVELPDWAGDPSEITSEVEIFEGGWFVGPVARRDEGVQFLHPHYSKAGSYNHFYQGLDPQALQEFERTRVRMSGPVYLEGERAGNHSSRFVLNGKVDLPGDALPEDLELSAAILLDVQPNTPRGQIERQQRPPHSIPIPVEADGRFELRRLVEGRYELRAAADGFETATTVVGPTYAGDASLRLRLIPSDLAAYGSPDGDAPPPLVWQEDHEAALAEARESGRPALALTHADWCAPCIRFEQTTLQSPWARAALAPFVLVEVNEDKAFNAAHDAEIYPTLIAFDGDGREITRITGFAPAISLLRFAQRVYAGLDMEPPAAMQQLMEEGVLDQVEDSDVDDSPGG